MNTDFLEALSPEDKESIQDMYQQVLDKEISPQFFFNSVKEIIGQENIKFLFSTEQEQDIRTDQLHDVIQYVGVDLKEEQENITKQTDVIGDYEGEVEEDEGYEDLLNINRYVEFINRILVTRNMVMTENALHTSYLILKRRLTDLIGKIIQASKIRIDAERSEYVIRIENDVKRQLWVLEQNEIAEMDKLKIKRENLDGRKRLKKNVQEREDLIIKKRMSNSVALAALGSQQKSWMSNSESGGGKESETAFQSLYSPFDEKEHIRKIKDRTVTMQDFIYVLERDKKYNKSVFTIQQYYK